MWARAGVALAAAASSVIGSAQQPTVPFTIATDRVVVPVVVEDRKGVPIRTLRQDDFTITEDARPVAMAASWSWPWTTSTPRRRSRGG
jgi:hypothetical protein